MSSSVARRGVFWISFAVVLLVVVAVLDRVGVVVAQNAAESKLAGYAQFGQRPTVRVHGVPFITQAIRGVYRDIEVTSDDLRLGDISNAQLDVHLHGAHVPLSQLVRGRVTRLPVDRIDGTVTLPYAEVAQRSGVPGLTLAPAGGAGDAADDTLVVSAPLAVPGFGQTVNATAQATATLSGDALHVSVTRLQVAGVSLPDSVAALLAGRLAVTIPLPELPYGLQVRSITMRPDGIAVSGAGQDVVLHAQ